MNLSAIVIAAALQAPAPQVDQLVTVDYAGQPVCMRVVSIDAWAGYVWLEYAGTFPVWVSRQPISALKGPCLK